MPTREPRWRWAVPLSLRPLRMTDLSAGECLVRLTGRADTPHSRLLQSFSFRTALRCVIDSATPAVQGGLLTAGSGTHPARCTGIGFVLRPQPDPDATQARCSIVDCPATPISTSFPPRPAVFAALRGIGAVSLGHTPASVAILRSLACASPPVAIARTQHPAWNKFKARCCRTDNSGIDEHKRNRYCVSDALTYVCIITAQCHNRPAYSAFNKSEFVTRSAGRLGDPERERRENFSLFNPLIG